MILAAQQILMALCIVGLVAIAAVALFCAALRFLSRDDLAETLRKSCPLSLLIASLGLISAILYGGSKAGRITFDSQYIRDAGAYLTNDVVHIAVAKAVAAVPDETPIWVYWRDSDSTNAADWVRFEPVFTLAEHPHDYALADATNYNVLVMADFVPAPTVHTNGVWQMKGFVIPGSFRTNISFKAAFPNTRRKEVP